MYVVQSADKFIERCLLMTTDPGDIVFDPTCGSGTSAFVAEKWGRRWITCDTSRIAISIAKKRMITASYDYYVLRYPHEGIKGGFVYKMVPHISLGSVTNNPDIDTIYDEEHPKIVSALEKLNLALAESSSPVKVTPMHGGRKGTKIIISHSQKLNEWEVPFHWPTEWPINAKEEFENFHYARKVMHERIDTSIANHADMEPLYDKPTKDKNRVRISGPFSVEAVPAPTVLALNENYSVSLVAGDSTVARSGETSRQAMWKDELLKTGVIGKKRETLKFAELETMAGTKFLHASGSVKDTGDRIVVSFGPRNVALDQRQVKEAVKEARTLVPKPKLILFCAFNIDPIAVNVIKDMHEPDMTCLSVHMNADLDTQDLKKGQSTSQSFWFIGQPEIVTRKRDDNLWEVEVLGFDYFNPKSSEVESGDVKQIEMWSLDVDYDQLSMMPQQVFFPMANNKDGWNRLGKTLRSELDEEVLEQFHGTLSLPFEAGKNNKIAVKIIDIRGIESVKIDTLEK